MDMLSILQATIEAKASDLLIAVGLPPTVRIHGQLQPLPGYQPINREESQKLVFSVLKDRQRHEFEEEHEYDFSVTVKGLSRFRVNAYLQRGVVGAAFRPIASEIPSMQDLDLPPIVTELARLPRGLVLVTGPTGSGKSTTLASVIDLINTERQCHIITMEDPIEFVHRHKKAVVDQREVHADTHSFTKALRSALRQDPDVILVGEMRDLETIAAAITIAETGHMVFSTLHTQDAAQTIDRIIDVFPAYQQQQIRTQLAVTIKGVVSQQLLPKKDGKGRIAAREILMATPAVCNLIREGKTYQLYSVMQTSTQEGMITMEADLVKLYRKGLITQEEAENRANAPEEVKRLITSGAQTPTVAAAGQRNPNIRYT